MNWIFDRIRDFGNSEAIIFNNKINTYFELYDQIEIYYQIVLKRIVQGSVVAILSDYSFPSIALFFALYKNRNIIVPIAARNIGEINEKVNEANCDFRISIDENKLQIVEINNKSLDHDLIKQLKLQIRAGLILFSSGSTGKPKTMVHDLDNLIDSYRGKKGKRIVFLIFLMFDHIGGLNTMFNCISMGVTMVFPINRNP